MNNEPVAWTTKFPKTVQDFSFYQTQIYTKPLYTHPVKELNDGGEPVKNATYWKRQYNLMATQNDNLKSGLYHANEQIKHLESHPVKELSRMDVYELAIESGFMLSTQYGEAEHKLMPVSDGDTLVKLANAILRKAQEK